MVTRRTHGLSHVSRIPPPPSSRRQGLPKSGDTAPDPENRKGQKPPAATATTAASAATTTEAARATACLLDGHATSHAKGSVADSKVDKADKADKAESSTWRDALKRLEKGDSLRNVVADAKIAQNALLAFCVHAGISLSLSLCLSLPWKGLPAKGAYQRPRSKCTPSAVHAMMHSA